MIVVTNVSTVVPGTAQDSPFAPQIRLNVTTLKNRLANVAIAVASAAAEAYG